MLNFQEVLSSIDNAETIDLDKSFSYAQFTSFLLKTDEAKARILIVNILAKWDIVPEETREIWTDLIEAVGFYPYLEKEKEKIQFKNLSGELRKAIHSSENLQGKYFHLEQLQILRLLEAGKNVIVSAPTSFGKSLLIEEMVASRKHRNIVIIQPTLALLDETRKKLLKYKQFYKLLVRTSQIPNADSGNIFLFTAERVNEYSLFPKIDFVIVDEFYKLSGKRDDERSSSLNCALYYLLKKYDPQFYLLGPNIDSISKGFAKNFNAEFVKSDYSLVASKTIDYWKLYQAEFESTGKTARKEHRLFELLDKLIEEQTIIYCSSPPRVRALSQKYVKHLEELGRKRPNHNYPLNDWIRQNVNPEWNILDSLAFNIGIHDGALQKHISTSIIDYFNQGSLKYLFCTSTIIEGVNTSARNIIYFDDTKGGNPIDFFDYSNIKGRAGRMMEHYVGNIYNFNPPPKNVQVDVDIPFFEQSPIRDELLIHLDPKEILNPAAKQFQDIASIPEPDREIIKKNGVKVSGQRSIFEILREDINYKYDLIQWELPNYKQLTYILGLAWDHLIMEGETTSPMTKAKIVQMTFNYGIKKNINQLVSEDFDYKKTKLKPKPKNNPDAPDVLQFGHLSDKEVLNLSIQEVFQTMKHWFEYKIPKWLSVLNEIQKLVCLERGLRPGNYRVYANLIENDFLQDNLAILAEYGVPSSALRKLEKMIPKSLSEDAVIDFIKTNNLQNSKALITYEQVKLKDI